MPNNLDNKDIQILKKLQSDARITNNDLAEEVGLSPSPCLRRVKRLEQEKIIKGYAASVDAPAVGLPISVFVTVTLKSQDRATLKDFESSIGGSPAVMECYLMTGTGDYLLRVVVPDLQAYELFLAETLTGIPCVASIQSSFALKQVIYKTALPISQQKPA